MLNDDIGTEFNGLCKGGGTGIGFWVSIFCICGNILSESLDDASAMMSRDAYLCFSCGYFLRNMVM